MRFDPAAHAAMATRLRLPRSPWLQLLTVLLDLAEGRGELLHHAERTWASATFTGSRHGVKLAFTGPEGIAAADRFIAALPEYEFAIPNRIVADAAIVAVKEEALPVPRVEVEAELLVLDDC